MATLEMVPLRSMLPTGRVTLRHSVPVLNPAQPEDLMRRIDEVLAAQETTTTPKVAGTAREIPAEQAETPARKGGQAR
jgi:hypothetical protein